MNTFEEKMDTLESKVELGEIGKIKYLRMVTNLVYIEAYKDQGHGWIKKSFTKLRMFIFCVVYFVVGCMKGVIDSFIEGLEKEA